MKAFLTGSRAYGSPNHTSDVDLVVLVSPEDLKVLEQQAAGADGSGNSQNASLRYGRLNLIALTDPIDYEVWAEGTRRLVERAPVTRPQAVKMFDRLIAKLKTPPAWKSGDPVPVSISLLKLVGTSGTGELWPGELHAFVDKILQDPKTRINWGACADWLDDCNEPELAAAFRYVDKRPNVELVGSPAGKNWSGYWFTGLPPAVSAHWSQMGVDTKTVPGACAALARALTQARKDLE